MTSRERLLTIIGGEPEWCAVDDLVCVTGGGFVLSTADSVWDPGAYENVMAFIEGVLSAAVIQCRFNDGIRYR